MTPFAPITRLEEPQRLGRYLLFYEIARGGMGVVYLARRRSSRGVQPVVALKRLDPQLARDETFRRMFLDEARIASQLSHPNAASAIDVGEEGGELFLTMPFVVGEPLARVIEALHQNETIDPSRVPALAARILMDACEGLHAAHELRNQDDQLLQVVHRDVTPRNVIVGYDGVTRVIDFGIASAAQRLSHTATGTLKGTPAYASPEHVQGQALDRRADIWSLGVLTFELCTGKRLFDADDTLSTIDRVLHQPIAGPCEIRPMLPIGLDEITLRALNRDRTRRYATAREMGREFALLTAELGTPCSAAEVAECMAQLFPGEESARRRVLMDVRSREVAEPPRERRARTEPSKAPWLIAAAALGSLATWISLRVF